MLAWWLCLIRVYGHRIHLAHLVYLVYYIHTHLVVWIHVHLFHLCDLVHCISIHHAIHAIHITVIMSVIHIGYIDIRFDLIMISLMVIVVIGVIVVVMCSIEFVFRFNVWYSCDWFVIGVILVAIGTDLVVIFNNIDLVWHILHTVSGVKLELCGITPSDWREIVKDKLDSVSIHFFYQ